MHLATDWEPYAEHMMDVLSATEALENEVGDRQFSPRPESRPETKFERRGHRLGHGVWDLLFTKR
jgi:tRNA (guanine-N7-)-methyltransferase